MEYVEHTRQSFMQFDSGECEHTSLKNRLSAILAHFITHD